VQEALNDLPAKQRLAIVLRYYDGLGGREIAAAMQTSVKAIERLLARGRAALETRLADFFPE
jgi:RNA polymerase sigma-70 factor (ECF subfamily)